MSGSFGRGEVGLSSLFNAGIASYNNSMRKGVLIGFILAFCLTGKVWAQGGKRLVTGVQRAAVAARASGSSVSAVSRGWGNRAGMWEVPLQSTDMSVKMPSGELTTVTKIPATSQVVRVADAAFNTSLLANTFKAYPIKSKKRLEVTGAIFQLDYNGKTEIYGAVASHRLISPLKSVPKFVDKKFFADVYIDGEWKMIPAKIVQLGAPKTLDVTLIKFQPQDEAHLKPLLLAKHNPAVGVELQSAGFRLDDMLYVPGRVVREVTPLSFRTSISGNSFDRIGLCGGPVGHGNVLDGIHTGSTDEENPMDEIGFATRAEHLRKLVDAYHTNGQAYIPIEVNGHHLIDLQVDEYVHTMKFLDAEGRVLSEDKFSGKFSYSRVAQELENPQLRYVEINTARVSWNREEPDQIQFYTPARHLKYDVVTKQVVSVDKDNGTYEH